LIDDETRQFIVDGLDLYSAAATGFDDWFPVNFVLRGARGDVLGGLLGQVWGGWLHVTYLWVAKAARRQGHGTQLLLDAEAYASTRGAVGVTLETYSFHARPFYERLGYQVFGTIDGYPPGRAKFFLRKKLT
jgi:ribosomal protein S18 acetylase RimI-like enzyme